MFNRDKKEKSFAIRLLGSMSAIVFLVSAVYIYISGFALISSIVLLAALCGLCGQVIIVGFEGIVDFLISLLEALVEGVMGIFLGILAVIGAIFS